jgi:hypothetical protein
MVEMLAWLPASKVSGLRLARPSADIMLYKLNLMIASQNIVNVEYIKPIYSKFSSLEYIFLYISYSEIIRFLYLVSTTCHKFESAESRRMT